MDMVKECKSPSCGFLSEKQQYSLTEKVKKNWHFIFPFGCILAAHINSFIVFYQAGFKYDSAGLQNLFSHRVFPQELWFESDITINVGLIITLFIYGILLFRPSLDPKYCIFIVGENPAKIISNGKGIC